MNSLLLVALLAAAPVPRPLPSAEPSVYLPRLDRLGGVLAFLERAGEFSVALRPATWREDFLPLLAVDPTRVPSLVAAGVDPSGSATVNAVGEAQVTCVSLKDVARFEARAKAALEGRGAAWASRVHGVPLRGVKSVKEVTGGYALSGNEACVAEGPGTERLLGEAAALLSRPGGAAAGRGVFVLPGAAYVSTSQSLLGLEGDARHLEVEGRSGRLPLPSFRKGGESPYGGIVPSGLLFARAQVDPAAYPQALGTLEAQVSRICPGCERARMEALSRSVSKFLTGQVLWRVDRVEPSGSLRTAAARAFAVKTALLAEVQRPQEVKAALESLAEWKGVSRTDAGFVLALPEGRLELEIQGNHLCLSNDETARKTAWDALAASSGKGAKLPHGAEFFVEPKQVARALARIPLWDALGSRELAGLLALSTELGPLLAQSDALTGWVDSTGAGVHRFSTRWVLPQAPPEAPPEPMPRGR